MTNTYDEEKKEPIDGELTIKTCNPGQLKCTTCVWAYVFHHIPTDMSCGQYKFKPKKVYFDGAECPKYEALKNI